MTRDRENRSSGSSSLSSSIINPGQVERSAGNLLHFLLFVKIFLMLTSISFILIGILNEEQALLRYFPHRHNQNRKFLLYGGIYLGIISTLTGFANILALMGLRIKKRFLLLPYLTCLLFGAMFSFFYLLGATFLWGFQDQNLIVLVAVLVSSGLLLRLFPVYMILGRSWRSSDPGVEAVLPNSISGSIVTDEPPHYESLDSQLPGYEDDIVIKDVPWIEKEFIAPGKTIH